MVANVYLANTFKVAYHNSIRMEFTPKNHGGAKGRWWKDNMLQWTFTTTTIDRKLCMLYIHFFFTKFFSIL